MKVAFLCQGFPPEVHAGTEMVAAALAQALAACDCEVAALAASEVPHRGEDCSDEVFQGVRVRRLHRRLDEWDGARLLRPRLLALVRDWLLAERPDVVHVHHFAGLGAGQLEQCRSLSLPVVLTFHDMWVTCARYFRLPPPGITCPTGSDRAPCGPCVQQAMPDVALAAAAAAVRRRDADVRASVAAASRLTAPSRFTAAAVQQHLPWSGPIEVIPHGLLRPVARARGPRRQGPLRLGTFGNLVAEKGVLELLLAVAGLPIELHLSGPFLAPEFEASLRAAAARQHTALVLHGRYVDGQSHPATGLDLAVFPSKCQETYGLVVDEALAAGVPVVVSDAGAFAERRGTGGVVVTPLARLPVILRELCAAPAALAALAGAVPAQLPTIADAAPRYAALYRTAIRDGTP